MNREAALSVEKQKNMKPENPSPVWIACALVLWTGGLCGAADPPPGAKPEEIPAASVRPVVVRASGGKGAYPPSAPASDLPEGFELRVVAAPPLVHHPIMGCVDDRGRLFVGDAVGVNWNNTQLDAQPPNRVLLLEDTDGDGVFDKSTVFADRMTFPQGGCWLEGSLYVCSPPGVWKLTDTDEDGVADQREMIVSGFNYTGNAADVHGPWAHPDGRLYWCHGRKGHKAVGKEGVVVHEGLASGIWSCYPDGSDLQWHSLACGDNPVRVDFTPHGDVIGVHNLYYGRPRGDTLMHWLYGGVYERLDILKAIEGLPRTLPKMPVVHNFGHVAVSGCAFSRSGMLFAGEALQLFVTHFNTQRLVRVELTPSGSSYKASEHEFLRMRDPDIHLTDVVEDRDGSLLLLNTGGWFRSGCPSSLMAKPDVLGAVYRIQRKQPLPARWVLPALVSVDSSEWASVLTGPDLHASRRVCEAVAKTRLAEPPVRAALLKLMSGALDGPLEHSVLYAAHAARAVEIRDLEAASEPVLVQRLLRVFAMREWEANERGALAGQAFRHLESGDAALRQVALQAVLLDEPSVEKLVRVFAQWLEEAEPSGVRAGLMQDFVVARPAYDGARMLAGRMLAHASAGVLKKGLEALAVAPLHVGAEVAEEPLLKALARQDVSRTLVLDAARNLLQLWRQSAREAARRAAAASAPVPPVRANRLDPALEALAEDASQPLPLRLRAMGAMTELKVSATSFALLKSVVSGGQASPAARIQAATLLAAAPLQKEQLLEVAGLLSAVDAVELGVLLKAVPLTKDAEVASAMAGGLARNPAILSQQESAYRTAFSAHPPKIFETQLLPAIQAASQAMDEKKRTLSALAEAAQATGRAEQGRVLFEQGKGSCIVCHQIGEKGRAIGPNLSAIGAIRSERDLLESILFPSNTLARDYEAHVFELNDGTTVMGVVKSHTAEGVLVVDVAGQEKNLSNAAIIGDTQLPTSLMPAGLDATMAPQELLDLVAYLRSLR